MRVTWLGWVMVLACAACAQVTPYQRLGHNGGIVDRRVAPGVYDLEAYGNGYTSSELLTDYIQRQSNWLCQQEGFPRYRLRNLEVKAARSTGPTSYYANTIAGTTYVNAVGGETVYRYAVFGRAVCMTADEGVATDVNDELERSLLRERLMSEPTGAGR